MSTVPAMYPANLAIHLVSPNTLLETRERKCAQTWSKLNAGIQCAIWNADDCHKLVASRAPWLFSVYKVLRPMEKVYVAQYLISYLFGGLCVPLHVRCVRPVGAIFNASKYDVMIFGYNPVILSLVRESPFWLSVLELVNNQMPSNMSMSLPWKPRVGPQLLHKFISNSVEILQNPRITILRSPYFSTKRIRNMYGYIYKDENDQLLLLGGGIVLIVTIIVFFLLKK